MRGLFFRGLCSSLNKSVFLRTLLLFVFNTLNEKAECSASLLIHIFLYKWLKLLQKTALSHLNILQLHIDFCIRICTQIPNLLNQTFFYKPTVWLCVPACDFQLCSDLNDTPRWCILQLIYKNLIGSIIQWMLYSKYQKWHSLFLYGNSPKFSNELNWKKDWCLWLR